MSRTALSCRAIALCLALLVASLPTHAQTPTSQAARDAEVQAAIQAGLKTGTRGPATVTLIDEAALTIPADTMFIPKAEGARIMRAYGNTVRDQTLQGLVVGLKPTDAWAVTVSFIKEGYIKDDEAKNWNADQLLQNLKNGTAEANKDRVARGFPELEVIGWAEKPAYDPATHRLVWSMLVKPKGAPDTGRKGINYNTYALGRDGYFSLNLVTNSDRIGANKVVAHTLLAALAYNPGKGYDEFNASTDRIAAYGIAALIGGVAAKKLGLFALASVFVLKFAKIIGVGAAAFVAGIWKFFGRRRSA